MNQLWKAKNITKSEPMWGKLDKQMKYDLLGLSDKEREYIHHAKIARDKRKADKKAKAE